MDKRRLLKISKGYNFRDIGGYTAERGKKVRWGKIFRASSMSNLSKKDVNYLENKKIDRIIDFRTTTEVYNEPDKKLNSSIDINIPAMSVDQTNSRIKYRQLNQTYEKKSYGYFKMLDNYKHLIEDGISNKAYYNFFKTLVNEKNSLIFHCTAGKDRTGIASMLLMGLLGINYTEIKHDYLLSNRLSLNIMETRLRFMKTQGASKSELENIKAMWTVNIDYLNKALDTIKGLSGNLKKYLKDYIQLKEEDINILKEKYLFFEEPNSKYNKIIFL